MIFWFQNPKTPKDKLSKDERKALKQLQCDTLIVILPADKVRSTVILNCGDYFEKYMDQINNGPHQLLKKDCTTKIKAKTLKKLKALKNNEFIDNKLYYFLTCLCLDFMVNQKYTSQDILYALLFHIVAPHCTILILINT